MSFYTKAIYPRILRFFCSRRPLVEHRRAVLSKVRGEILEIGFGTGLNLPHYPADVRRLTTADTNEEMHQLAQGRIEASPIEVHHHVVRGDRLPLPDDSFDTVVTTWTLCCTRDVFSALREIQRVLRPGGQFLFLEHGLSDNPRVQRWQRWLNPLQKIIADGCHLDRNIGKLVSEAGFEIVEIRNFYLQRTPKFGGYMYDGRAVKSEKRN